MHMWGAHAALPPCSHALVHVCRSPCLPESPVLRTAGKSSDPRGIGPWEPSAPWHFFFFRLRALSTPPSSAAGRTAETRSGTGEGNVSVIAEKTGARSSELSYVPGRGIFA